MKKSVKANDNARILKVCGISAVFCVICFALLWGYGGYNPTGINTSTATGLAHKILCCGGGSVLLSVLLCVFALEAGRDPEKPKAERPDWYYPLMGGILSLSAMCVVYSFLGMWPFGEKTGMIVDMHHQYAPLLAQLRDSLLHGTLSTYTFSAGPGANFLSMFGYYMASPLNVILVLFPERLLPEGILVITLLKNALCGAFFALCLQTVYKKKGLFIPTFSVLYSLMVYLIAYSWNIMWLDVIMMMPIVVLGFERLMEKGKFLTYTLSLAYCLFANYYIAFMLCIFLVLYYLAYVFRSPRTGKEFAVGFGKFAGCSLLAGGLAAFLILPVFLALGNTSAAGADLPTITNSIDLFEMIGRHLAVTTPTIRSGNLPNIYCGVLTLFCLPLFALNKGIAPRRRATYMALWLALSVSFVINWTDLAWHGLHSPNDLPYRFSFVYSFFLLLMAYEVILHLQYVERKHVFAVFAGLVTYLVLEERFGSEKYGFLTVYGNLALIAVYTAFFALVASKKIRRRVAYAALLLIVSAEMILNGGYVIGKLNGSEYYTRHDDYVDNTLTEVNRLAVERLQAIADKETNGDFYRMELLPRRTCVDTALYHYRGVTTFSSSNYYNTVKFYGGVGYAINGVNSILYHSFIPFVDSVSDIRYVILDVEITDHAQLTLLDSVTVGEETRYLYRNEDALGLGFMVDDDVKDFRYTRYNPVLSQEHFRAAMLGDDSETLYNSYTVNCDPDTIGSVQYNGTSFQVNPTAEETTATFTAEIPEGGQLYLYVDCNSADSLTLSCGENSWDMNPHESYIVDAGVVPAESTAFLTVTSEDACSGNFYVFTVNDDVYRKTMDTLAAHQLKVGSFTDNRISGTVTAAKNGVLMTTIPYDSGWTVKVDGKPVSTFEMDGAFVAFDLAAGTHAIEFIFVPEGLIIGLLITAVSLVVLILLLLIPALKRKRKEARQAEQSKEPPVVVPAKDDFAVENIPVREPPVLPDTLEELTGISDAEPPAPDNV